MLVAVGYTVAIAGVFTMSGGMVALTLAHYTSWHPAWEPLSLVLTVGAIWLTARGVRLSTTAVGWPSLVQVPIMVVVCLVVLIDQRAELSGIPFSWSHLTGGLAGLSAGFPLALYMFIGWENGPALAEECRDPRRTVPRALFISVAIATALFVLFAYSTVTGFHYDVSSIGRSSVPFLTVADRYLGGAAVFAWLAGIVSVLAALVAAVNSQSRMLFDGGRSGLLPAWLGRLRPPGDTPVNALLDDGRRGPRHHRRLVGVAPHRRPAGSTNPVGLYAECSTMGTIVILFVYLLTTLSLPVFMWRRHRTVLLGPPARRVPVLGALSLDRPVRRAVQAGPARPVQRVPLRRAGDPGGGGDRGASSSPQPVRGLGRGDGVLRIVRVKIKLCRSSGPPLPTGQAPSSSITQPRPHKPQRPPGGADSRGTWARCTHTRPCGFGKARRLAAPCRARTLMFPGVCPRPCELTDLLSVNTARGIRRKMAADGVRAPFGAAVEQSRSSLRGRVSA